jgi:hypothetical protein
MMRASLGHRVRLVLAILAVAGMAASARAQQVAPPKPPAKKGPATGQTIEIRGQAPTPQVVTVRPREVPHYAPVGLPNAVMSAGGWSSIANAYAIAPANQLSGRLPMDTSAAGLARGGEVLGGAAAAAAARAAAINGATAGASGGPVVVGASAAEIEDMRRELTMRKARLDSLERALRANEARQSSLGPPPPRGGGAAPRASAADSVARVNEIEAIRRELEYRRARLDSLQREVNSLGRPKQKPAPPKSDTSTSPRSGTPPRGIR